MKLQYALDLTVVNDSADPTFRFMPVDWARLIKWKKYQEAIIMLFESYLTFIPRISPSSYQYLIEWIRS